MLLDYFQLYTSQKTLITAPYLLAVKKKYLGKDDRFADASYELFQISKTNQLTKVIPALIQYPLYIGIFYVIYHPISMVYSQYNFNINKLFEIASTVNKITLPECSILSAVQTNPELFEGIKNINILSNFNTTFLGINITSPVEFGTLGMIFPIITIALLSINLIMMIKNYFKSTNNKFKFNGQLILVLLMLFVMISIATSSFYFPILFHIYYYIFFVLGKVSINISKIIMKKYNKAEFDQLNEKCKEIAEKYELNTVFKDDKEIESIDTSKIIEDSENNKSNKQKGER